jgi:RNA polymerase sigma factor (sigma-70 family)
MNAGTFRRILGIARRDADPTDDAGLLARFAATGDADAFELLVWRHGAMVLGVARRVLGDEHVAEDVFQATFLALARQCRSVRRDGCVGGWLHRVARRVAMRARRQRERRLLFARSVPMSDEPIVAAVQRELSLVIDEELDRLPERFRRPVVLCYLEGRSTAEAAEQLGCPRGTVLSRLATAREKLHARLLRRGVTPAILPATDSVAVLKGDLFDRTVRAAVAKSAAPEVIELCDGVVRAMMLSNLKTAAAAVFIVGLLGGGGGWAAFMPGTPRAALADEPQPKADSRPRDAQRLAEERAQTERKSLLSELATVEDRLAAQEEEWLRARLDARMRVAEAQERVKRVDRGLATFPDPARDGLLAARQRVASIQPQVESIRRKTAKTDEEKDLLANLEKTLKESQEDLRLQQADFDDNPPVPIKVVLSARRELIDAEERLSSLDRRQELRRRLLQSEIEALKGRLIQFQAGIGVADPIDRKVQQLERKLDDVLREVTELRRDLKK